MKSQKRNKNAEVDWDELEKFWADQYAADYGKYFSSTLEAGAPKSKESTNQSSPQNTEQTIPLISP